MFTTAEQTLKVALKSLGKEFYVGYLRHALFFRWQSTVGETIAKNVQPARIDYKTLFVYINNSSWKTEFQFQKSGIIKKLNEAAECRLIEEILLSRETRIAAPRNRIEPLEPTPDEIIARELSNITLTDAELGEIEAGLTVEDEQLRAMILKTAINRRRLKKCREKHGWHACAKCEMLVPPDEVLCNDCERKEREEFRRQLGQIIRDAPWLKFADVYSEMQSKMPHMIGQCYPETVAGVRSSLVQELARRTGVNNPNQVKRLVMLYRQLPPDQLSDEIIRKTMRRLRFDLPTQFDDF